MNLPHFDVIAFIPEFVFFMLVLGGIAAFFINPEEFEKTRTRVFISIMGSIAVMVLCINVILTTSSLESQKTVHKMQFTKQAVDKLWLFPNQLLTEKKHLRPEFLASLYYNNSQLYQLTRNLKTEQTIESVIEEQYVAIVFIQAWEDFMIMRKLDTTGDSVWYNNFMQWAQSPYLKEFFDNLKYNFASTTVKLGELLFEYAARIPIPSTDPEAYQSTVNDFMKDPRLQQIYIEHAGSN